jgi:osmotically-inducible protein OsmY
MSFVERRNDADLREAVLRAFELSGSVPPSIDAHVHGGRVTITGTAAWNGLRYEAAWVAARVPGVTAVDVRVELSAA